MKSRFITATEFKTKCLALLDEVTEQGSTITVTRRGQPVATLSPAPRVRKGKWKSPIGILEGKVKVVGDIVNANIWDAFKRDSDF